jgi:hypothetical protein
VVSFNLRIIPESAQVPSIDVFESADTGLRNLTAASVTISAFLYLEPLRNTNELNCLGVVSRVLRTAACGGGMCSRRELESLVVFGLQEIRSLERLLQQKWAGLATGPQQARAAFLQNLAELQEQTVRLEKLVSALDEPAHRTAPLAA